MKEILGFIERNKIRITIVLILVTNLILKILFVTNNDIANDEPFSIFHAQMPLQEIVSILKQGNNPPLYEIFLHFWIKIFNISAFWVRLPSVIFSSFTAVVIFIVIKKLFQYKEAVTAAFIFTFSTTHFYFAHEARTYPLFVLLSVISLLYFIKFFQEKNLRNLVVLVFVNTLLLYSHYFAFFVILNQCLGLIVLPFSMKKLRMFLIGFTVSLLLFSPLLFAFINQFFLTVSKGTWVESPHWTHYYGFINIFLNSKYNTLSFIMVLVTMFFVHIKNNGVHIKQLTNKNRHLILMLLWFLCPYTLMFVASFHAPMFIERYLLFTSVFLYMALSIILWRFQTSVFLKRLLISICLLMMPMFIDLKPSNKRNIKETVNYIKNLKSTDDIVFVCPDYSYFNFAYYYSTDIFKDHVNSLSHLQEEQIYPISSLDDIYSILESNTHQRIIYLQAGSEFVDPQNNILSFLKQRYNFIKTRDFFEIYSVSLFEK